MKTGSWFAGVIAGAALCGCGDAGLGGGQMMSTLGSVGDGIVGAVDLVLQPGEGVAGVDAGVVLDGWTVHYSKVIVGLHDLNLSLEDGNVLSGGAWLIDLTKLPAAGQSIGGADARISASWFGFSLANRGSFVSVVGVEEADLKAMSESGLSLYIEGTIEKKDGQSCTPGAPTDCAAAPVVTFRWGLPIDSTYGLCDGVQVTDTQMSTLTFELPATHWLHTNFTDRGAGLPLRAQWIADADADRDGETTLEELMKIDAATLLPRELDYDFTGGGVIDTGYDFLVAQARLLGRDARGMCEILMGQ